MHNVPEEYSSCTGRSSENLSSSSGGAQEKKKDRVFPGFHTPLNVNVRFAGFFLISPCMTESRVPVPSFPDFTNISNIFQNTLDYSSPYHWLLTH
jgi:hypothetical protein